MKVHIIPALPDGPDPGDGGIRQVVRAQHLFLPEFGWQVVANARDADVIACHIEVPPAYLRNYPDKPLITHNHGAYWSPDYEWEHGWCYDANARVLEGLRVADITTAVSEWTAHTLRRHSNRDIRVVYHGVDSDEWTPGDSEGYVLWNKTRTDPICDPQPVLDCARALPDVPFISTFLPPDSIVPDNVTTTGRLSFDEAREVVRRAGVYLCTTRETFGIGTLEALASGVPVVGYAWGGQKEIITHGVDGWLVPPGDIAGLAEGIRWARGNAEARAAARETALRFPVRRSIEQYAAIYQEAYDRREAMRAAPRTSIIVTAYKLAEYLPDTLDSVLAQEDPDWECVIVDDASPDACGAIADEYAARDPRFRVIHNETNQYLAGARNTGITAARGRYILPLDADDMLPRNAIATLADELDRHRGLHIVYGNVRFVDEDGRTPTRYAGHEPGHSGWPVEFRLDWMLLRPGQPMPYASMYRREVWESTGGYRTRARSSEDCDMWLRATSYGFVAQMVTSADMLIYRNRAHSMSRDVGWQEHRGWYPWVENPDVLPAAAYRGTVGGREIPFPALDPVISVVIPVGPGHDRYVHDAIDSVDAQTFRLWECIVINDSGAPLPPLPRWVRIVDNDEHRVGHGVAGARNAGIRVARGALFLPLDADDMLQPEALQMMLDAHMEDWEHRPIVYSDFWDEKHPGTSEIYQCPDYDPRDLTRRGLGRAVTALTPIHYWRAVGGYDESLPAWEDWGFALRCAEKGFCERRVAMPLFTYRKWTGERREQNMAAFDESRRAMMATGFELKDGELMACSTCPGGRSTTFGFMGMSMTQAAGLPAIPESPDGLVMIEYIGSKQGEVTYRSKVDAQKIYRFSARYRQQLVLRDDAERFMLMKGDFALVARTGPAAVPMTAPAAVRQPLVAAGAPTSAAVSDGPGGLPWYAPAPPEAPAAAAPVSSAVAPTSVASSTPIPGVPENDLSNARAAAGASVTSAPPPLPPEAIELARAHSRDELNEILSGLGHPAPATLRTKDEVARVIVALRASAPADTDAAS